MKLSKDDLKKMINKDSVGDWIVKYKRQVAVGCIALCLVVVAGVSLAGSGADKNKEEAAPAVTADAAGIVSDTAQQTVEEANKLEKDAYPEVNAVVQKYFDSMAAGDMETLASVEDTTDEEEQNRILRSKDLVEGYQNISCYTKKGLTEGSYLVFVYYELKFAQIETAAPGLSALYVYPNEEGNLVIFNGEENEELNAYVEKMVQEEDVLALREEVKAKYEEAKLADENLVKQEERYQRIAQESAEQEAAAAEETAEGEEAPAEGEEAPAEGEEAPAEGEEAPAEEEEAPAEEETPEEESSDNTATAQNRETRFTESVKLRAEPSTEAEYLGTVYYGESVTQVESYEDGWSKIIYNGEECYCMTQYLE